MILKHEYIKKYLVFFLFILLSSFALHKYYVSVTEVYVNKNDHSLDMILRVFPDDLENVLSDTYAISADLTKKETLSFLKKYIKKKYTVSINNKYIDYKIVRNGIENDFYTILLQAQLPETTHTITIKNTILQDMYDEQKNIIHFFEADKKMSFILEKQNPKASYSLQNE